MPNCYYYDEQRNRCNCYVNENLNELLAENAKLRELIYDFIVDEERGHNDDVTFREHVIRAHEYGIAQGIEVDG